MEKKQVFAILALGLLFGKVSSHADDRAVRCEAQATIFDHSSCRTSESSSVLNVMGLTAHWDGLIKPDMAPIEGLSTSLDSSMALGKAVSFEKKTLQCDSKVRYFDADRLQKSCQTMRGFGFAVTESTVINFEKLPTEKRREVMEKFFDPKKGAGLSYLVVPLSASDFNDPKLGDFSVCDCPKDQAPDPNSHCFDPSRIEKLVQFAQEAKKLNPSIKVMLKSWSPPPFMKKRRNSKYQASYRGGDFDGQWSKSLAACLSDAIEWTQKKGVPVQSIAVQNEPGLKLWYPSMAMDSESMANVLDLIQEQEGGKYPHLQLVLRSDNMVATWGAKDTQSRMKSGAKNLVYSGHCYSGGTEKLDPFLTPKQKMLCGGSQSVEFLMGECTGSGNPGKDDFSWWIKNRVLMDIDAGATGVLAWNGILDEQHGPRNNGCAKCRGLLTTDFSAENGPKLTWNPEYQALAQLSRFVQDGAKRLVTEKDDLGVDTLVFKNPDSSKVGFFLNSSSEPKKIRLVTKDCSAADVTIEPRSVLTLRWN